MQIANFIETKEEILREFLNNIFGENAIINFSCIRDKKVIKKIGIYDNLKNELKRLNKEGYNIYFVVNSGGYKDKEINKINALFIDIDTKENKLNELMAFNLPPSYVVETKNGYHAYWLLNDNATVEEFKLCEELLINYFNADKQVKNPARLMRLPEYNHVKEIDNPYPVKIIVHNNIRYDIKHIIEALGGFRKTDKKKYITIYQSYENPEPLIYKGCSHVELIQSKNISKLQEIINPVPVKFNNHDDVYNYLKKQDLMQFLGINYNGKMFNCIFHDDENPSATILISENEHQIYYCFGCGFKGTIIQCVERIQGTTRVDALRYLRAVYKVEYEETEWQKKQKAIIEENMRFILSNEFQELYPETYRLIKPYINDLYVIHGYAKEHVYTENFTDNSNNALFFASIKYLLKICNRFCYQNTNDRIALFTLLGLLNKLKKEQIPDFLLKNAIRYAKGKNTVTFFSIPSYTYNVMTNAEEKAKLWKEKNCTMKGMSYEMILRNFGYDEANKVYPQMQAKEITSKNKEIAMHLEKVMLNMVYTKGYATEKEILAVAGKINERNLKKILGEVLKKYGLKRVRANKELKEKFYIKDKGYPYLIML
ncbi:MAG: CHC2 zinc finger domain-containing protein [Caldisericum exile]